MNGTPIFAKGANVVPFGSFPNRVTPDRYRHFLVAARGSNINMARLWGSGYHETGTFYDMCDELGLMMWHDFMFGNNWQPDTYDFK